VPGDVVEVGGKNVLVVNTNNLLLKQVNVKKLQNFKNFQKLAANQKVVAAQNVFWTPLGVVRAWSGVTYPSKDGIKLQKG
jgi:hypothetical protein